MMNKKVLKASIISIGVLLLILYFCKIFFTKEYAMVVQNDRFVEFGVFVDANKWLRFVLSIVTSFIVYWLFLCGSLHKRYLNWKECLMIIGAIAIYRLIGLVDEAFALNITTIVFPLLLVVCKADCKFGAIIYSFHTIAQALSLSIRGLAKYLLKVNYITIFFLGFECYLWLLLFYCLGQYNNTKKEE